MNIAFTRSDRKSTLQVLLTLLLILGAAGLANAAERRVLVYTKNGKGYVHNNIPASVAHSEISNCRAGLPK